jgi:hypothetical protein
VCWSGFFALDTAKHRQVQAACPGIVPLIVACFENASGLIRPVLGQRGWPMELPYIRAEIERMRLQVRRQRKHIQALHPDDER